MKNSASLSCLILATALLPCLAASAQEPSALHVVKSVVNAESENAELCLEFDKPLAGASPAHLAAALRLEQEGKPVTPQNIAATGTSLCLFPLERSKSYHLDIGGLHSADEEKMTSPYKLSFTIPDRSPTLAFTDKNGGVNEFGSYDSPITLRAVNVSRAKIEVYRITDTPTQMRIWQDRAQEALAPSESAFLARKKGQPVLRDETVFAATANATAEQEISLSQKMANLEPGLYLIVADAGKDDTETTGKELAPLAAAWFTKSDFTLRAVRDADGIHVLASQSDASGPKGNIHLLAENKKTEPLAEAQGTAEGVTLIPYPAKLADKNDITSVIGIDPAGNVAFADVENLRPFSSSPALGLIRTKDLFALPNDTIGVSLSRPTSKDAAPLTSPSLLRLSKGDFIYAEFPVPLMTQESTTLLLPTPVSQGLWTLHWQNSDGTALADSPMRVTTDADTPHLEVTSDRDYLTSDASWPVTIKSVSASGKIVPLTGGHIDIAWQKLDPAAFGWKDYRFGTPTAILDAPVHIDDFLTDVQGTAQMRLTLPKPPQERGLYQALLKVMAEPDAGVADAPPLVLGLRPDSTVIGIKPLATDARFTQNGIARFALIGLSSDGKPRDMSGISYQVYEEGRSFAWYQDEGRWKFRPEPQLRPIGGGALTVKADASTVLEWPVTAGNYRLEILDSSGKLLAQTTFSAGWDSSGASTAPVIPLNVTLPKILVPGQEVAAHVTLPEAAMLTVIVSDQRVRKVVHELRNKGDNVVTFTPEDDWQNRINLSVEAAPQNNKKGTSAHLRGETEAQIAQARTSSETAATDGTSVVATDNPAALLLRKDSMATLSFGIENNSDDAETYHYAFTASPGLKLESGDNGTIAIGARQSRALSLSVFGTASGAADLRLDVTGTHAAPLSRSWHLGVLQPEASLRSEETKALSPGQPLLPVPPKPRAAGTGTLAFVSRLPMDGLAEILSYVFNAQPFTTTELALTIDSLRLWNDTLTQAGIAPDFVIAARKQELLSQLLRHQNADGGFSVLRGGNSTMGDTAEALTALGPLTTDQNKFPKTQAIGWIKQHLANTWLDEKERAPRAAAYAALAAADAIDPASLHYFSDTSATDVLPPIAEAHIAAAFKHIRDPNAAAFWIRKMLDENNQAKTVPLLDALAATDALSSDDVHAAMKDMTEALRHGNAPTIKSAAELLRALAADNADAGKIRLSIGNDIKEVSGVLALVTSNPTSTSYHSADSRPLSVTLVSPVAHAPSQLPPQASIARHIYRINGVELLPPAKPAHGEIYMVELKGTLPTISENQQVLIQDGSAAALRPLGCPLTAKLDTLSFIPWFTTHDLSPLSACEYTSHEMNAVVAPTENDSSDFSVVYFARIDALATTDIQPPRLRIIE